MDDVKARVLLIGDDEDDYVLVRDLLFEISPAYYDIVWAKDYDAGVEALAFGRHDVCLLEYRLGSGSGIELMREAASRGSTTPVIFLTSHSDARVDFQAMRAGAADYLVKDEINSRLLDRSIRYAIEFRRAEESLRRLNRTFKMLSECNHSMVHAQNEDELLDRTCRIVVEIGAYRMAWIGYAEKDEKKTIRPVAQVGDNDGYLDAVGVTWSNTETGRGPGGTAIRKGEACIVRDICREPGFLPWRAEALKRGYRSVIALPLTEGGRTFGILAIYADEPNAFPEDEVKVLTELAEDLAYGIVALRTRAEQELAQKQVRHAQKMEAIGTLASGIAHDFNNILGIILGHAELALIQSPSDLRLRSHLRTICSAGDRAKDLVTQILTFCRETEQERRPVGLSSIVKEAVKLLRASIPSTIEIRRRIEVDHGKDIILADPIQIHQVLMNLCTNAGHAMSEGGGLLDVSLSHVHLEEGDISKAHKNPSRCVELSPGQYVKLTVSDTGHGIEPKIIDNIFDPYFTTKEPGEGSGLGLAVVHGIVESHGGAIHLWSEVGEGATFEIFFPFVENRVEEKTMAPSEEMPTGNETILFVDDEERLAYAAGLMLEYLEYRVVAKTCSIEALDAFRADPYMFDLVITDLTMPQMTGFELSKELLRIRPDIPIILLSGFSDVARIEKSQMGGIREFVTKPLMIETMATTVRRVLDEKRHRAGSEDREPGMEHRRMIGPVLSSFTKEQTI